MRVTIEHREQATGALKNHKDCYVDCRVEFTEEERAIIKERDLYGEGFYIRTSTPFPSRTAFISTGLMRAIGGLMAIGGFFYGLIFEGFAQRHTNYGGPIFFVGIGLAIWGWVRGRNEDKRVAEDEQRITVKQLLNKPTFTVHAWNAGYAKGIEDQIREHLVSLKDLIKNSAQLQAKQTFDL